MTEFPFLTNNYLQNPTLSLISEGISILVHKSYNSLQYSAATIEVGGE